MTNRSLRAAIFDYGHTLVNFQPAEDLLVEVYEQVRLMLEAEARADVPQAPELVSAVSRRVEEEVMASYRGGELDELDIVVMFEDGLRGLGLTVPRDMVRSIAELEHRTLMSRLLVKPETLQTLAELRDMGLSIGLVSNAHFLPEMMREDIERLGILQYVDDAVFSAEIGVRKPHPAIFQKVLDELGVTPSDAIFVGDRLRDDVAGAKKLGMRGVLTHEFRQEDLDPSLVVPDLVIERLSDLVPFVKNFVSA